MHTYVAAVDWKEILIITLFESFYPEKKEKKPKKNCMWKEKANNFSLV